MKRKKTPALPEDSFIKEVNEDLKNDQLRLVWKKYGLYIIIAVALILTVTVSFESIKAWRIKQNEAWSDTYAYALSLQNQGRFDESIEVLQRMKSEGGGIYADIAKVQISNVLFDQGKINEAVALLQVLAKDKKLNKQMHNVVIIKLASYKVDTAPAEEVIELLKPLIEENGAWTDIAKEMLAILYIRENNFDQAREIYYDILNTPNIDEELSRRVKDMLSVLNEAS